MGKKFKVTVKGETFEVEIEEIKSSSPKISHLERIENKEKPEVTEVQKTTKTEIITEQPVESYQKQQMFFEAFKKPGVIEEAGTNYIFSPLPGKILSVNVKKGSKVKKGSLLLIIEAMKMENEIFASEDAIIKEIFVSSGDYVSTGDKLIMMEK
jgi:glutaconyl-CoA decarboxylase